MKKTVTFFIALLMLVLNTSILKADNNEDMIVKNNLIENDKSFIVNFNNPYYRYFVFIYDENKTWFVNNMIGPSGCENGGFYIKDFRNNTIRRLIKPGYKIDRYDNNDEYICFTCNNKIYVESFLGDSINLIYEPKGKLNSELCIYKDYIYFAENNYVKRINAATLKVDAYSEIDIKKGLCLIDDDVIGYWNNNKEYIVRNLITNEFEIVDLSSGCEEDDYCNDQIVTNEREFDSSTRTLTTYNPVNVEVNFQSIYTQYPENTSYFTVSGLESTSSRKYHSGSSTYKQCYAFAFYSYDVFSHRMTINSTDATIEGNKPTGDYHTMGELDGDNTTLSTSEINAVFNAVNKGSHLRMRIDNYDGSHSFLLMGIRNDGKYEIYHANWQCSSTNLIKRNYWNKNTISSCFDYYDGYYSHNFTSLEYENAVYHKYVCNSCSGYYLESHDIHYTSISSTKHIAYCSMDCGYSVEQVHIFIQQNGANVCKKCGYVGGVIHE